MWVESNPDPLQEPQVLLTWSHLSSPTTSLLYVISHHSDTRDSLTFYRLVFAEAQVLLMPACSPQTPE